MKQKTIIKKSLRISPKSKVKGRADRRKTLRYKTKKYVVVTETEIKTIINIPDLSRYGNLIKPRDEAPENLATIIILNYNTLEILWECIQNVLVHTKYPYELIVVDNASTDGSIDWLKTQKYLHLITNKKNLGFSKANNKAIKQARGKYVLLLNSDVYVRSTNWLREMVKLAESNQKIGTVGAKLLYPNGKIQHVGGGIHETNPYHPYDKQMHARAYRRNLPFNTGACLLIKRTTLEKVGLLNEKYPFGFEDVDYGLRVVEKGLSNVLCHKTVMTHLWAYTQRKTGRFLKTASLKRFHQEWDAKLPAIAKKVKLDWGKPYCE